MISLRNLPAGRSRAAWLGMLLLLLLSGWVSGGGAATGSGPRPAPFDGAGEPGARVSRAAWPVPAGFADATIPGVGLAVATAGPLAAGPAARIVPAILASRARTRRNPSPPRSRFLPRGPPAAG